MLERITISNTPLTEKETGTAAEGEDIFKNVCLFPSLSKCNYAHNNIVIDRARNTTNGYICTFYSHVTQSLLPFQTYSSSTFLIMLPFSEILQSPQGISLSLSQYLLWPIQAVYPVKIYSLNIAEMVFLPPSTILLISGPFLTYKYKYKVIFASNFYLHCKLMLPCC